MHRVTNGQLHEIINFLHILLNETSQAGFSLYFLVYTTNF